jgi:hypothetical protein
MTRISITTGATGGSKRRAATHYGTRDIEDKLPSKYAGANGKEILNYTFSFDDLPVAGLDEAILRIPANARISRATLRIITAFAGGTSYNLGLQEEDASVIDADGIDAAVALTAIDAIGDVVLCDGALVGTLVGIGAAAGQLVVAATGTFTAGKAQLEIEYDLFTDRA